MKIINHILVVTAASMLFLACEDNSTQAEVNDQISSSATTPTFLSSSKDIDFEESSSSASLSVSSVTATSSSSSIEIISNEADTKTTQGSSLTAIDEEIVENLSAFERTLLTNALGETAEFEGYDKLSEDEKNSIKEEAAKEGAEVAFNDDVMVVKDEDGEMQYGNIVVDEGLVFGMIPAPGVGRITMKGKVADGEYVLVVLGVNVDQAKQYSESLKQEGYKKNVEEDSEDGEFLFYAEKSHGSSVEVSHIGSMMMINLVE